MAAATSQAEAAQAEIAAARLQLSTTVAGAYAELARLYDDRDSAVDAPARPQADGAAGRRPPAQRAGDQGRARPGAGAACPRPSAISTSWTVRSPCSATPWPRSLGLGPDAGLAIPRPKALAGRAFGLPPTVGVDLVGRRPDLTAARLRVEAAAKNEKGAKADYYPNISISGDYGLASLGIDKFVQTPDSIVGALGPSHPPADLQSRPPERRLPRPAAASTTRRWPPTTAPWPTRFGDVADAAVSVKSLQTELADAQAQLASAQTAYNILQLRYTGGLSPFLNVLTAEDALITARRTVADLQGQAAGLDITLVRTLAAAMQTRKGPPRRSRPPHADPDWTPLSWLTI